MPLDRVPSSIREKNLVEKSKNDKKIHRSRRRSPNRAAPNIFLFIASMMASASPRAQRGSPFHPATP
jgi:hypothetical protein